MWLDNGQTYRILSEYQTLDRSQGYKWEESTCQINTDNLYVTTGARNKKIRPGLTDFIVTSFLLEAKAKSAERAYIYEIRSRARASCSSLHTMQEELQWRKALDRDR